MQENTGHILYSTVDNVYYRVTRSSIPTNKHINKCTLRFVCFRLLFHKNKVLKIAGVTFFSADVAWTNLSKPYCIPVSQLSDLSRPHTIVFGAFFCILHFCNYVQHFPQIHTVRHFPSRIIRMIDTKHIRTYMYVVM